MNQMATFLVIFVFCGAAMGASYNDTGSTGNGTWPDKGMGGNGTDGNGLPIIDIEGCEVMDDYEVPFLPSCGLLDVVAELIECLKVDHNDTTDCTSKTHGILRCVRAKLEYCDMTPNKTEDEKTSFFDLLGAREGWKNVLANIKAMDENSTEVMKIVEFACSPHNASYYPEFMGSLNITTQFCNTWVFDAWAKWVLRGLNRWNGIWDNFSRCSLTFEIFHAIKWTMDNGCSIEALDSCDQKRAVMGFYKHLGYYMNTSIVQPMCSFDKMTCPAPSDCSKGCEKANAFMCNYHVWRLEAKKWLLKYWEWKSKCIFMPTYPPYYSYGTSQGGEGDSDQDSYDRQRQKRSVDSGDDMSDSGYGQQGGNGNDTDGGWMTVENNIASWYLEVKCQNEDKMVYVRDEETESHIIWCSDGKYQNWAEILYHWQNDYHYYDWIKYEYMYYKDQCYMPDFSGDCGFDLE